MGATMGFYEELGFDYVLLQQRDTGSGRLVAFYEEFGFRHADSFLELAMLAPTRRRAGLRVETPSERESGPA
jgi:hypothetical protein